MATGRPPYRAETPPAIFVKHLHDPLPPPRTFNPALPQSVENVILKSLAKGPKDRYASVAEFVGAIHAAIPDSDLHETVVESTETDAGATILEPYIETPEVVFPTEVEPELVPPPPPIEPVVEREPSRPVGGLPRIALIGGAGVIVVGAAIVALLLSGGNDRGTQDPDRTKTAPTVELEGTLPPTAETTLMVETKVPEQFTNTPAPTEPSPGDLITNPVDGAGLQRATEMDLSHLWSCS